MAELSKNPAITVLMSVRNGEKYLEGAVASILNQTFTDFEFIIIDDSSTDGTAKILAAFKDPRIILLKNETRAGLTKSLNKGLKISHAIYVARMDADDITLSNRLEIQKKFLDENLGIVCVGSATTVISKRGVVLGQKQVIQNPEVLKFRLITANQLAHPTVMFRKETIMNVGAYNEKYEYVQDFELWCRLSRNGHLITNISQPLVLYRFHDTSVTQNQASKDLAYDLVLKIIRDNISTYIQPNETYFLALTKLLHKNIVSNLKDLFAINKLLSDLTRSYLNKEMVSTTGKYEIMRFVSQLKKRAFWAYLRYYIKHVLGLNKPTYKTQL